MISNLDLKAQSLIELTAKFDNTAIKELPENFSQIFYSLNKGEKFQVLGYYYLGDNLGYFHIKHMGTTGYINQVDVLSNFSYYEALDKKIYKTPKGVMSLRKEETNNINNFLPPIIKINSLSFSNNFIEANSNESINLSLLNSGPGDAKNVVIYLSSDLIGITHQTEIKVPVISKLGGEIEITIPIQASINIPDSIVNFKLEIFDKDFSQIIKGKKIIVPTYEFKKPKLIIPKNTLVEGPSATPNQRIDKNEIVKLKFLIQNLGQGIGEEIEISVENNEKGVLFLGEGDSYKREAIKLESLDPGQFQVLEFNYLINSDFMGDALNFDVTIKEKYGLYGLEKKLSFTVNSDLEDIEGIDVISFPKENRYTKDIIIQNIPDFVVDVDQHIPKNSKVQFKTYALIIGNEDYQSRQTSLTVEQNVDFAVNDALVFSQYCEKTLGIPQKQIKLLKNSTYAEMQQGLSWLENLAKIENGNAKLIFYYSGHGLPDDINKEPYLIPTDVSGQNVKLALKLEDVYNKLTSYPSKQVLVFLDACFSGGARNESLLAMKGMKIKPQEESPLKNMVVFSSSSGEQTSAVNRGKQHGYFTYSLLKKLQESKGEVTLGALFDYISQSVAKETAIDGIIQTPQLKVGENIEDSWRNMKLSE